MSEEFRDEKGKFMPGHRFWEARSTAGPKPKFQDPKDLWNACVEYFKWVEDNPLYTVELVKHQGDAKQVKVPKMRAMTYEGLCIFLDIQTSTWRSWRDPESNLSTVVTRVEEVIRTQKFSGAAADLLNSNIIARDLGLADKKAIGGDPENPVEYKHSGVDEFISRISGISSRS